jgi:hypothetical protein
MDTALILFGISLTINIVLGIFAIVYPMRVSNRDYTLIRETLDNIKSDTLKTSTVTNSTHLDIKNIEQLLTRQIINDLNTLNMPLSASAQKTVGTTVSSFFNGEYEL